MEKNKLLLIPFFTGLTFIIFSWFTSYPLTITSVEDSIFNHIPLLYWFGFGLLLTSLFMMSITFKNTYLKWLMAVGCVLTLYSLSFFYYTLPGSDAHYFSGLTLNFVNNHDLDASQFIHSYYQWPSFFILADTATLVSGISYSAYAFLLFGVIGFLLATTLYVYGSKFNKNLALLAVISFFIVLYYFFNFQAVPFSLAFTLFLILFILQVQVKKETPVITILTIILFTGMSLTHAFVPLFFILYLFIVCILKKSKWHFGIFLLTVFIYLLVQVTLGRFYWAENISKLFTTTNEFGGIADQTLVSAQPLLIDVIAQIFSRIVTVGFGLISGAGFLFILIRKKLSAESKAIFLSGIAYLGVGLVLYTLGSRAISLVFLPVSLGLVYLVSTRYRRYLKALILILLVLFVFVPIHASLNSFPVTFQTKEAQTVDNFMIAQYNWSSNGVIISDNGAKWYISPQVPTYAQIDSILDPRFPLSEISNYDCIIYSVDLDKTFQMNTNDTLSELTTNKFSILYSSGPSYIAIKNK